jgi:hypothetical protein
MQNINISKQMIDTDYYIYISIFSRLSKAYLSVKDKNIFYYLILLNTCKNIL